MTVQNVSEVYKVDVGQMLREMRNRVVKLIPEDTGLFRSLFILGLKINSVQRHKRRTSMKIDIPVTEHCNLSCTCCTAFGPLAKESFLDIDSYTKDMRKLAELTRHQLDDVTLTGGEPLLHPRITEILDRAREFFPNTRITILTNGVLLLKMSAEFWQSCQKNRVDVFLSRYPIQIDFAKIKQIAESHGVNFDYLGGSNEPIKAMWKYPLDLRGQQTLSRSFNICNQMNFCIRMRNGKIYPCNTIACIEHFNSFFGKNLAVSANDYLELDTVSSIEAVYDFLIAPKSFCKYCNRKGVVTGIKWSVSRKHISEWT
jgi:hypothetical protein